MTEAAKARMEAAEHLLAARKRGVPGARLPLHLRPTSIVEAMEIQNCVTTQLAERVGGWKCSLPAGERALSAAPIYGSTITSVSPWALRGVQRRATVEPEIAFLLGKDLPARAQPYSDQEIREAVSEIRLVLELIGSRYDEPDLSYLEQLADGFSNAGLFIGPPLQCARENLPATMPITVSSLAPDTKTDALPMRRQGRHPDQDPWRPLLWLANYLAGSHHSATHHFPTEHFPPEHFPTDPPPTDRVPTSSLREKQIVTTGSYCGVIELPLGVPLRIAFGEWGAIDVEFVHAG